MRNLVVMLLVAAVAMVAAERMLREDETKAKQATAARRVSKIKPAEVNAVQLQRREGNPAALAFEKRDDQWWIVQPEEYPATNYMLKSLVEDLANLSHKRSFAMTDEMQATDTYGLSQPAYRVELQAPTGVATVRVGERNPVGNTYFVADDTLEDVHVVKAGFEVQLGKRLSDFRMREMFWEFPTEISRVTVAYGDLVTDFIRSDAAGPITMAPWYYQTNTGAATRPAEKPVVDALTNSIRNLTATGFEPLSDMPGTRSITVYGADEALRFSVRPGTEIFFVRIPGRPFEYRVSTYATRAMFKPEVSFAKRRTDGSEFNRLVPDAVVERQQAEQE